jgi:hypothetical protein
MIFRSKASQLLSLYSSLIILSLAKARTIELRGAAIDIKTYRFPTLSLKLREVSQVLSQGVQAADNGGKDLAAFEGNQGGIAVERILLASSIWCKLLSNWIARRKNPGLQKYLALREFLKEQRGAKSRA